MSRIIILLICVCVPLSAPYCSETEAQPSLEKALYKFSINLLPKVSQEKQNHFIVSPLSIWTLLYSIWRGATEKTFRELHQVLGLHHKMCYNHKYQAIIKNMAAGNKSDVTVERSSNIFVDSKLMIIEKYKSKIIKGGLSSFKNISFENPNFVAQEINKYVSDATHNTINEIITPEDLDPTTVMILIDTVYFKGGWQIPFEADRTETSPFYNDENVAIGDVNLMHTSGNFNNRYVKKLKARVLEMPYGKIGESRYSMLFFLPVEGSSLQNVIENMKNVTLAYIKKLLGEYGVSDVEADVPRFKITSDLNTLKDLLADMGLKAMFDPAQARFRRLSYEPLYVSSLIQKANIEVTEEGTVASAASKADFSFRSSPEEFVFNRPFLFMIVDNEYDIPIFIGAYSKPTEY